MSGARDESQDALHEFLTSLVETKKCLKCPHCNELYVDPMNSKCGHTVCERHGGDFCVQCGVDVRNCSFNKNNIFETAAEAIRDLEKMYGVLDSPTKSNEYQQKNIPGQKMEKSSNPLKKYNAPKINIEKRNIKGETGLQIACRVGKLETIVKHIELGANPNTKDNAGWTPLHEVTQRGHAKAVTYLLKHGALPDIPGLDNETPLHEAVRYGYVDIAKKLIKYGADVKAKNIKGETPLSLANDVMRQALLNTVYQKELHISTCLTIDYDDLRVSCVTSFKSVILKLKKLVNSHDNLHIESKFTRKVTHLIVDADDDNTCICTVDILHAVVNGVWVLNTEWISKSTEENLDNHFEAYEVAGIGIPNFDGPKISRLNKFKQLPGLFDGCHVYLHGFRNPYEISKSLILNKSVLISLITKAGGKILKREPNPESIPDSEKTVPYHAKEGGKLVKCSHYIIFGDMFEPMYNMEHLKALPVGWLIECIQKYTLCDPW